MTHCALTRLGAAALGLLMWGGAAQAACAALPAGFVPTPPAELLSKYPTGGGALSSEVRNAVAADPSQLSSIMNIVGMATPTQRQAIGTGLGQAAAVCARPEETTTRSIQQAVIASANEDVASAFQAVTGDRRTTAVGGAGGAAGGAGGGSGGGTGVASGSGFGGGGSPFTVSGTSSFANNPGTLGVGGGSSVTLSTIGGAGLLTAIGSPTTSVSESR